MAVRMASVHGSAPKKPTRRRRASLGRPASSIASARWSAYEGVQQSTVLPRSWKATSCRSVKPPETGITAAPSDSAP